MKKLFTAQNSIVLFFFSLLTVAVFFNLNSPLQGLHSIRQADTTFAGWSYCFENSDFLKPRIAHRGSDPGVVIGEFPLFSILISAPCKIGIPWTEWWPRLLSFLFFVISGLAWGLWLKKQSLDQFNWPLWTTLYFACTTHLNHYTIPMPDTMAAALVAGAGLAWQSPRRGSALVAQILFTLAFAMRPYFIPLLFLVAPRKQIYWGIFFCSMVYLGWYKWWIRQSEWEYYYTALLKPAELLHQLPEALKGFGEYLTRNVTHLVGFLPLLLYWRKNGWTRLTGIWIFAWALVLAIRGDHIVVHSYYFAASTLILLVILYHSLMTWRASRQAIFMALYVLIGIINVQHLWQRQAYPKWQNVMAAKEAAHVQAHDLVATYVGQYPNAATYLYWGKMLGWAKMAQDFQGPENCPEKAKFYLIFQDDKVMISPCQ